MPAQTTVDPTAHTAPNASTSRGLPLAVTFSLVVLFTSHVDAQVATETDPTGVYTLMSVDGAKLPATVSHGNAEVEVRSGTFTIKADGTCACRTIFGPPSGADVTRDVTATFTQEGSKLAMQWKGMGHTSGTVEGDRFTMDNEGVLFSYRRQPGNDVLDRFLGTWRSVQTEGPNPGNEDAVDLTYSRRLGGRFVQEVGNVSGEDTAMILYTYDIDQNIFRLWRFAANDPPSAATGKWNAESDTLEWTYSADPKQDLTMTARHRFVDENAFEWDVVGRDSSGKVLFQLRGKATRTGQSPE